MNSIVKDEFIRDDDDLSAISFETHDGTDPEFKMAQEDGPEVALESTEHFEVKHAQVIFTNV